MVIGTAGLVGSRKIEAEPRHGRSLRILAIAARTAGEMGARLSSLSLNVSEGLSSFASVATLLIPRRSVEISWSPLRAFLSFEVGPLFGVQGVWPLGSERDQMRKRGRRVALGLVLALTMLLVGAADPQGQKKPKGRVAAVRVQAQVEFSAQEREQIRVFFGGHRPEGVKPIPPGIRKKLARGRPMPPGIAKQVLPPGLLETLPQREGYEVVRVGWDVVLVEVATGIVHDVLMDVIR